MEIICEYCKKTFKKPKCHAKRVDHHFCSRKCYDQREIEKFTHCITCSKEIDYSKRNYSRKFCGGCYKKDYKKRKPEQAEKARKYGRDKVRIRRGLPLDHPYLITRPGEGSMTKHGYRDIWKPGHPNCKNKLGRIYEHVWIMSEHLGRPLMKGETVHHKNGIRDDNRIENLELWHRGQPAGQRIEDRIKFYKEFLEQYGYKVTKE